MKQITIKKEFKYSGKGLRAAIILSEFNKETGEKLLKETDEELRKQSVENIKIFRVPGALEIPIVAKKIIEKKKFDVIIALGVIIKGETSHYEHVSRESIHGIAKLSVETGIPIISGILTVLAEKQAKERIKRGKEFARSAIQIFNTIKNI